MAQKIRIVAASAFLIIGAQAECFPAQDKSPAATFWWSLFVPGGGYFYMGEKAKGAAYFAGTLGLVGWGIAVDKKKAGGELNTPFVYAQQLHVTQIYLSNREALRKLLSKDYPADEIKILKDKSSLYELAASPFRKENLTNPWVIGVGLLGAGVNYAGARLTGARRDFGDMRNIQILGDRFNRDTGLAAYSAYWLPISIGATVSEESLFRGFIQTGWEERWGKTRGLLAASALFGAAHYDGSGESATNTLFAGASGIFFGWRFQQRDYRLSETIAEHFWFDALAGLSIYFADPENNPLGAKVEFGF